LVRLAAGTEPTVRTAARAALARAGRPAVDALAQELTAREPARRLAAAEILDAYRGTAASAVPALEKAAADPDAAVRAAAGRAAFASGSRAEAVVRALAEGFASGDVSTRRAAAYTASGSESLPAEVVAAAKRALADSDPYVRVYAALALARGEETAAEAAPALAAALRDPAARYTAVAALAAPGLHYPGLKAVAPALREVLHDPQQRGNPYVLERAGVALARLGDPAAVELIVTAITGFTPPVGVPPGVYMTGSHRIGLARALRECGPDGAAALRELLGHREREVRVAALIQFAEGTSDPAAVTALAGLLKDPDSAVRYYAVSGLRHAAAGAREAQKAAAELLRDPATTVRVQAAITVAWLGGPDGRAEAIEVLRRAIAGRDPASLSPALADALGRLGADAKGVVPDLVALLGRSDPTTVSAAARVLGRIGPAAAEAVPALTRLRESDDPRLKAEAALALWRVTGDAKPAAAALADALADPALRVSFWPNPGVVIPPPGVPYVPPPSPLYPPAAARGPGSEPLPTAAIRALGEMGPAAAEAADTLRQFRHDPDPQVREAAAEALKKVEPAGDGDRK
jgi:HEAT repeat protein